MKVVVIGNHDIDFLPHSKADYTYVDNAEEAIEAIKATQAGLLITKKPIHEMQGFMLQLKKIKHPVRIVILGKGNTHYLLASNSLYSTINHHIALCEETPARP